LNYFIKSIKLLFDGLSRLLTQARNGDYGGFGGFKF